MTTGDVAAVGPDDVVTAVMPVFGLQPDALRCPYPHFDRARAEQPVMYVPEIECWLVTNYDDIVRIGRDPQTFRSLVPTGPVLARQQLEGVIALLADEPELGEGARPSAGTRVLINADPPEHGRQRRLVNRAFTPPKVKQLEPRIREVANELVDAFVDGGEVEIVNDYAVPLPLTIIAECLGVADDQLPKFKQWSDDLTGLIGNHAMSREDTRSLLRSQQEFFVYFAERIVERRVERREDLISDLVEAEIDEVPLTDDEILGMLSQFLVAGNETTTKLIASAVRILLEQPERADSLRGDPAAIPAFVEEALRLEPPVQGLYRTAIDDTEVGGVAIKAGDHLLLMYAAGNRDEARFAEPNRVVPDRPNLMSHLSFGHGEHFCVGSALARAEGRIAIETLLERLDDLRPGAGVDLDQLAYEPSYVLHGIKELRVAFSPSR